MAAQRSVSPVVLPSTLDGEVIHVEERDGTVTVLIRKCDTPGEEFQRCITTTAIARRLACHICGPPVRLRGKGTWSRAESGEWKLHRFECESFELLDETPLMQLCDELRARLMPPETGRQNPVDLIRQLREE